MSGHRNAIPVETAARIAKEHGYDKVVILAVREDGPGWTTTWSRDKSGCSFLGRVAEMLHNNLRSFLGDRDMAMGFYRQMKGKTGGE